MSYVRNVMIALDQLLNALAAGRPDETLSSRMGRQPDCRFCNFMCRLLDKIDPRHCEKSIKAERDGAHLPPELRD